LGAVRPRPLPARRTLALCLALTLIGLALAPLALAPPAAAGPSSGPALSWWHLAPVFGLAAVFVFHVEINSEAHTFSLSEVPLVLGLLFTDPWHVLLARLLGEAVVLIGLERQSPPKLAFNLSLFFAETTAALAVFRWAGGESGPIDPRTWLAALLAVGVAGTLGAAAVWAVIRVHGGSVSSRQLVVAAAVTAVGNTSLASIAAVLMSVARPALIPLAVVTGVVVTAYRGYTRLTKRYAGLEMLYQFTRITSGPQRPDATLLRVLDEAGRLLRTGRALIALYGPGGEQPWLFLDRSADSGTGIDGAGADRETGRGNLPAGLREEVLQHGRLLLIPRTTAQPEHRAVLESLGAKDCIAAPLISGGEVTGALVVCDRLGEVSTFDSEDGRLFATLASQAAIALENGQLIERLQAQIQAREHEAQHDALTGLPNRTLLFERLSEALADPTPRRVGVLLLDLNGFKEVNDTLGHHTGDLLLREVAQRVRQTVTEPCTVARLGGDEFAVLLPFLPDVETGLAVAAQVNEAIGRPIPLASMALEVSASIGMSVWPDHGTDPATLLQRADVAMYAAKRAQAGVTLYDHSLNWNSQLRLRLASELRGALLARQIDVWYQPIARATDVEVVGAEALARWNHPELGQIAPDEFIPIAERSGLIHDLTLYVLDEALAQTRIWRAAGLELYVSVNLPPQVLRDVDWPAKVVELLHRHAAAPHQLTFEITETGIMTDPERMIGMLRDLAATGISFSIDDFGTGYSSLAYLQRLPVSVIKIDKSFVTPMVSDPAAAAIVRSVTDLAHSLDLAVVAEGVEDQRTLDHLTQIGCHFVQGFFLSRPIPSVELTEWMAQRRRRQQERPSLRTA
ncbi:MAG: GGDEF domain-containing protein, partial [Kineosporiaceae bacterium]